MKQIKLQLQKRLLIREFPTIEDMQEAYDLHKSLPDVETKLICKGSELFNSAIESSEFLLSASEKVFNVREYSVGDWGDPGKSVGAIKAENKDTAKRKYKKQYGISDYDINFFSFDEYESRTFNPEKTLIFEIL